MPQPYKYFAFISYSRKDCKAAAWLQKRLEWFRFPVRLVPKDQRPPDPCYVRPIYRDKTNLQVTDEHYWKNIRLALEQSRFLIVLASPNSAQSKNVEIEVSHFLATHGQHSKFVVPVVLNGSITDTGGQAALGPSLRDLGETITSRNLPSMVPDEDSDQQGAWEQGFVSLASYLLSLDRGAIGDHIQRETKRQTTMLRRWLAAVIVLAVVAIVGGVVAYNQKQAADLQARRAINAEKATQSQLVETSRQRERGDLLLQKASNGAHGLSEQELDDNEWQPAMAHTRQALELWGGNLTAAHWAESLLTNHCSLRTIGAWDLPITSMVFSLDGKKLYAETENSICAFSTERFEQIWSVSATEKSSQISGESLTLSRDGKSLAFIGEEGVIVILDAASGQKIKVVQKNARALASSPTAPLLAAAITVNEEKAKICFLDLDTFDEREVTISSRSDRVSGLRISPNGQTLAIIGAFLLEAIDIPTGKQISKTIFAGSLSDAQFSPDSSRIALSGRELAGAVVSVAVGKRLGMEDLGEKDGKIHNFRKVAYTPDGLWVATCGGAEFTPNSPDNLLRLFSPEKGEVRFGIKTSRPTEAMAVSEDGVMIAFGDGNTILVLDLDTGHLIGAAKFQHTPQAVAFSPGNRCLAVRCWNGGLYLLEPARATNSFQSQPATFNLSKLPGERISQKGGMSQKDDIRNFAITTVALSPSAHAVAFVGDDSRISVRSFPAGASLWSKQFGGSVKHLVFSPDGHSLFCVREEGSSQDHKLDVPGDASEPDSMQAVLSTMLEAAGIHHDRKGKDDIVVRGRGDCFLELFDTQTGSMRWMKTLPKIGKPIILPGNTIGVAGSGAWSIYDGKKNQLADPIFNNIDIAISCDDHVLLTGKEKLLQAYSLPQYASIFEYSNKETPTLAKYVPQGNRLYLAEERTVKCFTPPSAFPNWENRFSVNIKFLTSDANGACLAGSEGELRLLGANSGGEIWQKDLSGINDVRAFPDKGVVLIGQKNGYSSLIDFLSGRKMQLREHGQSVLALSDESIDFSYAIGRFGVNCEGVEISRFSLPPPSWFADDLLLSQGWHAVKDGVVAPVSVAVVGKALKRVKEEFERSQTPGSSGRIKEYDRVLVWMCGDRLTRTVSPSSSIRLVDAVEAALQSSSQENVHYGYYAAPWHPLAGFGLAATEENATRASYLRKWGLLRLQAAESEGMDRKSLARCCGLAAMISLASGDREIASHILEFGDSKSLAHPIFSEAKIEMERATTRSR